MPQFDGNIIVIIHGAPGQNTGNFEACFKPVVSEYQPVAFPAHDLGNIVADLPIVTDGLKNISLHDPSPPPLQVDYPSSLDRGLKSAGAKERRGPERQSEENGLGRRPFLHPALRHWLAL